MKKALVVLLATLMVVALALPSLAVGYYNSEQISDIDDPGNKKGIKVIPISDEDDPVEKKKVNDAVKEIENADDVTKLNDGVKDVINKNYNGLKAEDFKVQDIFVVKVDDEAEKNANGSYDVNVDLHYTNSDATPIFMLKGEDGQWIIVEATRNADNTFTLHVPSGGIIASFVPTVNGISEGGATNKGTKTSPQTGAENTTLTIIAVSAICLAGVAVVVNAKRKAEND